MKKFRFSGWDIVEGIDKRFSPMNTACVSHNGKLLFNTRFVNYSKLLNNGNVNMLNQDNMFEYILDDAVFESLNILWDGKGSFSVVKVPVFDGENMFVGLEDCRFVVWDGLLYMYGTRPDDGFKTYVYRVNDSMTGVDLTACVVIPSPVGAAIEKNWMAVPDKPWHFIYDGRECVLRYDKETGNSEIEGRRDDSFAVRGSTPLMVYKDGYLTLVHRVSSDGCYFHRFVFYDRDLKIVRESDDFHFENDVCEFVCGMTCHESKYYIALSILDCVTHVLEFESEEFDSFVLQPSMVVDMTLDMLHNEAEKCVNDRSKTVVYSYGVFKNDNISIDRCIGLLVDDERIYGNKEYSKILLRNITMCSRYMPELMRHYKTLRKNMMGDMSIKNFLSIKYI